VLHLKHRDINTSNYILQLETIITELRAELKAVHEELAMVKAELVSVKAENIVLKERIKELEQKSTSKNSSLPPSKDITRSGQTKSIRKSSGKKVGGQYKHKGHNLEFSKSPDVIIPHKIDKCQHCNCELTQVEQTEVDRQQVIDLPPIKAIITEHIKYQVTCPCCYQISTSIMPIREVKSKVQYGACIRTLVTYLNVRQVVAKKRLQELLMDVFNIPISQGTIVRIVSESAEKMADKYAQIKEYVQVSKVVGADETSCRIAGKNHWLWAYQNDSATYLYVHPTRGMSAIESHFPDGFQNSILVTDRWPAQLKTKTKAKQICLQHLIRDAQKLIDCYKSKWANKLQKVLYDIIHLTHLDKIPICEKVRIEDRLRILLSSPLTKCAHKIKTLQQKLIPLQNSITTCLYQRGVPPTNNGTEQSVRKMKIKMKIAGTFRSVNGADAYAVIQSILDTAIKQNIKPLDAIRNPNCIFPSIAE